MKVLYITCYTELLGANRSMMQLILELREKGVIPTVLIPSNSVDSSPSIKDYLIENNIPYIQVPIRMIKHPNGWKVILNYIYSLSLRRKALHILANSEFDLIHTNSSIIDFGAYLSKVKQIPHIWHLREFGDLDYNFKSPFGKWFQKIIYRGDNHFIAISKKIKTHYKPFIGKQKIHLIYNGVKAIGKPSIRYNQKLRFCVVGHIHENKRQFDVVRAINELVNKRHISNIHLSIIGGGNIRYIKAMNEYIKDNSLLEYVEFTGQVDNVAERLSQMDIGIMSSSNEAFGRVTIEYMMSGLAVIATSGGANCEIIDDGTSGLIYDVGNHIMLADKMQQMIENVEYRKTIAANGYKKANAEFSSSSNTEKIYELYNRVLGNI